MAAANLTGFNSATSLAWDCLANFLDRI